MAGIRVKKDLTNTENMIEGIEDLDKIIKVASIKLKGDLLRAWSKGENLSNSSKNKKLTTRYGDKKEESGRNPIRDLNVSGKLTTSVDIKRDKLASYSIGPRGSDEQLKMEGNVKYDKNLMKVSDKNKNKVVDFVNKRIKKGKL